uniref:di-heme-cytochrome C peroxidase n=1 Tax=Sandarakinorhabdus sp. TaxID=1916663 RepID=UPI00333E8065
LSYTKFRWSKNQKEKAPWVGLNCSACHTTEITHNGKPFRVDGAPTLADFQDLTDTLLVALKTTQADSSKFQRFSDRVALSEKRVNSESDSRKLNGALQQLIAYLGGIDSYNVDSDVDNAYGHGRLDAVGHILNKVAFLNNATSQIRGKPDAPVSYPFIWNTRQQEFVQWNSLVPNSIAKIGALKIPVGSLVRNTSQSIGVYADVTLREKAKANGYYSSVFIGNLYDIENQLASLMSPAWPDEFGQPTKEDIAAGKKLFNEVMFDGKTTCASCHSDLKRTDLKTPINHVATPVWGANGVGTDPWMMCNAYTYVAKSGVLKGTKQSILAGEEFGDENYTRTFLQTQAIGILLRNKFEVLRTAALEALGIEPEIFTNQSAAVTNPVELNGQLSKEKRLAQCMADAETAEKAPAGDEKKRILAYKARPLNGIWATAPFLHNGSVKSLTELLLEPSKRAKAFWVGNREIDTVNVGFVDAPATPANRSSLFNSEKGSGNSNLGHDYGNARISADQRRLLVEYMKSL